MFSGITNDDASLPGSRSVTEARRRAERRRRETEGERGGEQTEAKAGGRRVERTR